MPRSQIEPTRPDLAPADVLEYAWLRASDDVWRQIDLATSDSVDEIIRGDSLVERWERELMGDAGA